MNKTLKHFLDKEWSMGNGQCEECCGVHKDWLGHPCYLTPETVGHKKDCSLAGLIRENGGEPLYVGDFKSDVEYWNVISDEGFFSTEVKTEEISQPRHRMIDHNEKVCHQLRETVLSSTKGGNLISHPSVRGTNTRARNGLGNL